MAEQDIRFLVTVIRRAPLQNMAEAERVAMLCQNLLQHFQGKPQTDADVTVSN